MISLSSAVPTRTELAAKSSDRPVLGPLVTSTRVFAYLMTVAARARLVLSLLMRTRFPA